MGKENTEVYIVTDTCMIKGKIMTYSVRRTGRMERIKTKIVFDSWNVTKTTAIRNILAPYNPMQNASLN